MRVALASARIVDGDTGHNLAQMERYVKEAKAKGAELVCFGEAFLQGFNALSWQYEEDRKTALSVDSPEFARIKALTEESGIDVLFGYNELDAGCIYSSCALISGGHILHNYRRISKGWKEYWKTDEHYREGTGAAVFDYKGRRCAIALCGDLWDYPERFAMGEEVLFWPVYVSISREEWENGERSDYAHQAGLGCAHTLYVNSLCEDDAIGGAISFLNGEIGAELPIFCEGLLCVEI